MHAPTEIRAEDQKSEYTGLERGTAERINDLEAQVKELLHFIRTELPALKGRLSRHARILDRIGNRMPELVREPAAHHEGGYTL